MIRFDHITKQYPGTSRPALNSIDVEILRGEFVFLVGASGSGKSSCLRLVLKEEKPTSGSIHVMGQDLRSISNRKVPYFRRNIGVVFQDFRLLPNKTVYENVAFSLQVIGKSRGFIQEAVPDTLQMVGLAEKAQRLPHELSGGEQQRVAIARAIVNKPQILLADEPTGNLDPTTSAGIMALLDRINAGGTTVMMATHEAGIVDQMQRRVIELSAGQIVRDERRGGYATSAIPIIATNTDATATPATAPAAAPAAVYDSAEPALTHPPVTGAAVPTETAAASATPAESVDPSRAASTPATTAPRAASPAPTAPAQQAAPTGAHRITPSTPGPHPDAAPAGEPVQPAPVRSSQTDSGMPVWTPAPAPHVAVQREESAEAATGSGDATDGVAGTDTADAERPMTRPVLPVTQDDIPEQLTLAEKLGLRAPGEKPNPTGEQNVGPTR